MRIPLPHAKKCCPLIFWQGRSFASSLEESLDRNITSESTRPMMFAKNFIAGVLKFFCTMDPFESLVKPTHSFSGKKYLMHKIETVRLIEVNKHFCRPEAMNYFVAYVHYWMKSKFQLEVRENEVLFPRPSSRTPVIYPWNPKGSVDLRLRINASSFGVMCCKI
jgi:hypothetical protein